MGDPKPSIAENAELNSESTEFTKLFPEGAIRRIQSAEVPRAVMDIFEVKSKELINNDAYQPGNFESYSLISHGNGDRTYVAQQTKTYATNKDTETLIYFVDTRDGEVLGYSELRNNISKKTPYFKDKPFVGFTRTEKKFQQQGLGARRLQAMNAVSEARYHLPLYSDTLNAEKSIWEDLVSKGVARKFKEGENVRYSFIPSKERGQV